MLTGYNDFFTITINYLRNYSSFLVARDNLQKAKDVKKEEYELVKIPIAKYGTQPGGASELTSTEQATNNLLMIKKEYDTLVSELTELNLKIEQIDYAWKSLDERQGKVLRLKFVSRLSPEEIATEMSYSESYCRKLISGAVWQLCRNLFSHKMFMERKFWFVQ
ncbi:MAG: hypothetical protein P4N59_03595 [Negativicutes bacterium]|nr:hypothetical protein [Negativicutes bacterium]